MSRITLDTRVAAGAATAVVGAHAAALVDVDAEDPRADPLLAAIEAGGGLDEILEALVAMGFTDLPDFGIVVEDGSGLRAFTRGAIRLRIRADEELDPTAFEGAELSTWREVRVPEVRAWMMHLHGDRSEASIPLDRGVVDAARIMGAVQHDRVSQSTPVPAATEATEVASHDEGDAAAAAAIAPEPGPPPTPDIPIDPPPDPEPRPIAHDDTVVEPVRPPAESASDPLVKAIYCPDDHPNPPGVRHCITCEEEIVDRTVYKVPRPVIAVLLWDTGRSIEVDGPILAGRNPKEGTIIDGEPARVFRVADPEAVLSREHLEIRPSGWDVMVVDRGSRNFTVLVVPGEDPVQLEPHVPTRAPMGSEVILAESAVFRVDPPY